MDSDLSEVGSNIIISSQWLVTTVTEKTAQFVLRTHPTKKNF